MDFKLSCTCRELYGSQIQYLPSVFISCAPTLENKQKKWSFLYYNTEHEFDIEHDRKHWVSNSWKEKQSHSHSHSLALLTNNLKWFGCEIRKLWIQQLGFFQVVVPVIRHNRELAAVAMNKIPHRASVLLLSSSFDNICIWVRIHLYF